MDKKQVQESFELIDLNDTDAVYEHKDKTWLVTSDKVKEDLESM